MATTKNTTGSSGAKARTPRAKASTAKGGAKTGTVGTTSARSTAAKAASSRGTSARPKDASLVARTGRTIKERPYTSAAIATGAVGVVAVAAAAGAFLVSRRDKSFKEASDALTTKVKDGFASASETVKDLGQRGADYFKGDAGESSNDSRTQREIAEEALSLKATGETSNPAEELSSLQSKAGAISY